MENEWKKYGMKFSRYWRLRFWFAKFLFRILMSIYWHLRLPWYCRDYNYWENPDIAWEFHVRDRILDDDPYYYD